MYSVFSFKHFRIRQQKLYKICVESKGNNMKILVIGSGGREHALVWKLHQSPRVKKIYCAPGNAGTRKYATNIDIKANDVNELVKYALQQKIDLTIVGP